MVGIEEYLDVRELPSTPMGPDRMSSSCSSGSSRSYEITYQQASYTDHPRPHIPTTNNYVRRLHPSLSSCPVECMCREHPLAQSVSWVPASRSTTMPALRLKRAASAASAEVSGFKTNRPAANRPR